MYFFLYEITFLFFICTDEIASFIRLKYLNKTIINYSFLFGSLVCVCFDRFKFIVNDTKFSVSALLGMSFSS